MEEHEKIQLRSDEIQEILGTPPNWIVRWGSTVIFLTVITMLAISWMVKYSDVVPADIIVTTPSPPMTVVAETEGRLLKVLVEDKQEVTKGDLVVVMESSANYEDMMWLADKVEEVQSSKRYRAGDRKLKLGEVQYYFSDFERAYKDYSFASSGNLKQKQIRHLRDQISNTEDKIALAKKKEGQLKKQIRLAMDKVNRTESLERQGAKSEQDVENAWAEYNRVEQRMQDLKTEAVNYEGEIDRLEGQITQIQQGSAEGKNDKSIQMQESLNNLAGEIDKWKKRHLITAPLSGRVTFFKVRSEQQFVNKGEDLMMIVPERDEILGRLELPIVGAGKVDTGQVVNIFLKEFPHKEFGIVRGKVKSISLMAHDSKYIVEVNLPDGLQTSYKKELQFRQEMEGQAEIKTAERRFIERIFDKFSDMLRNS